MADTFIPEFSRDFHLDKGLSAPVSFKIKASEAECTALARRFDLLQMKEFWVELTIEPGRVTGEYEVQGSGCADVIQACVVSLQDVPEVVNFTFHTRLVEGIEKPIEEGNFDFLEEEIDIDYYQNSHIDLGEIATQYLSLSLNLYPKAPGMREDEDEESSQASFASETTLAFALLEKLKEVKS